MHKWSTIGPGKTPERESTQNTIRFHFRLYPDRLMTSKIRRSGDCCRIKKAIASFTPSGGRSTGTK